MTEFLFGMASPIAYLIVFGFLILCGVGNPLPEDTVLIAAGYLAFTGVVNIYYILVISYIGILGGDLMLYYFGRRYGQKIIEHPKFLKLIPIKRVDQIRRGFQRWGHWMVFFARFLVGFRSPTFLLSGVMKVPFKKFLIIDIFGALISVPLLVGLGYLFGEHVDVLRHDIKRYEHWIGLVVVSLIAIFFIWRWAISRKPEAELDAVFLWEPRHAERKRGGEEI